MRVFITGGAGFLGSALAGRLLAEGHAVDVLDDLSTGTLSAMSDARAAGSGGRFTFHQADVRVPEVAALIARRQPDVIFHLAGVSDPAAAVAHPAADAETTVLGMLNVIEGARAAKAKVVFAAGAGIYGPVESGLVKESAAHRPRHPHSVAEVAAMGYLEHARVADGLDFTVAVIATAYGPGDTTGVVGRFAAALADGESCVVHGDGEQTRDLVYVDDVMDALARTLDRAGGLTVNIGTGRETSIRKLHAAMCAVVGAPGAPVAYAPARTADLRRVALDTGRAGIHLGWRPWTTIPEGLAATLT